MLLRKPLKKVRVTIDLPSSKSESNRLLVIEALARWQSGQKGLRLPNYRIGNISQARDTRILQNLLQSSDYHLDVQDAGTTMRFLTAFCAVTQRKAVLQGTARMHQRPIGILVEALRELGAEIAYLAQEGFPPIAIYGFEQKKRKIAIQANVSSQFISALLMVAPVFEKGLELTLSTRVSSLPYVSMTLFLMKYFGIESIWQTDTIVIEPQLYQLKDFNVEADWSAASYWYSVAALSQEAEIFLPYLRKDSLQGDCQVASMMEFFGVKTFYTKNGVLIRKVSEPLGNCWEYDFSNQPDLAQTFVALCVGKRVTLVATGLESLKIKETNRLQALQNEVEKFGWSFHEIAPQVWKLEPQKGFRHSTPILINTYQDHRMAMAFAPLSYVTDLLIEEPTVVEKSYPNFWQEWQKITTNSL